MRITLEVLLILALCSFSALADTFVSGPVAGIWTLSLSPYVAVGDIDVPAGQTLTIEPGVVVKFSGMFRFYVHGTLMAVGTPEARILMTHSVEQPDANWRGLRFFAAQGVSELGYCDISWGYAQGIVGNPDSRGGGVYVDSSLVYMHHCNFSHNKADVKGGAVCMRDSWAEIAFCTFSQNSCRSDGGGLFLDNCDSTWIHDNVIISNQALNGGGLVCMYSPALIEKNQITLNLAESSNGGAMLIDYSSPAIHQNTIRMNFANGSWGSGIYTKNYSNPLMVYNQFNFNGNAAVSCSNHSSPLLINNTITMNNNNGIWATQESHPSGTNNILWDNLFGVYHDSGSSILLTYSDVDGGMPGIGNFNANPCFVGGLDLQLMPYSPCIDQGNPLSPLDPDCTIADVGAYYFDQTQPQGMCNITATPLGAPIVLPPSGGTVYFTVLIQNTPDYFNLYDGWYSLQQPDSQVVPMLLRTNLYLAPGGALARTLTLTVSASAMPGTYTVYTYVGDHPASIEDWDSFTFVKSAGNGDNSDGQALVSLSDGQVCGSYPLKVQVLPRCTGLLRNYPNPFNPSTTLSYELRAAGFVNLRVYDTAGRLVATLVDGWRQAGTHEVTFDGSRLVSGVYFIRMQATEGPFGAGEFSAVQKMMLVK
jgi:hypothetical protein